MSNAKEIRNKIQGTRNTQKITSAMEMVAASKMRRTQERMQTTRPYAEKIFQVIENLAWGHSEYRHPFLEKREIKSIGFIVVSSDRGLCGGLNNNLFRVLLKSLAEAQEAEQNIKVSLMGRKAIGFFKSLPVEVVSMADGFGDTPSIQDLIGSVDVLLEQYIRGEIDALYVAHNRFINTMSQKPTLQQLLPLKPAESEHLSHYWDYIYEPEPKELLDMLLKRFIESEVYQAVVENIACEQAAKMVAMKSASDNANDLIKEFQLIYNKARQAAITQEIAEIVGGAAAV